MHAADACGGLQHALIARPAAPAPRCALVPGHAFAQGLLLCGASPPLPSPCRTTRAAALADMLIPVTPPVGSGTVLQGADLDGAEAGDLDIEGFSYNSDGAVVFDSGHYSAGPEFIGACARAPVRARARMRMRVWRPQHPFIASGGIRQHVPAHPPNIHVCVHACTGRVDARDVGPVRQLHAGRRLWGPGARDRCVRMRVQLGRLRGRPFCFPLWRPPCMDGWGHRARVQRSATAALNLQPAS